MAKNNNLSIIFMKQSSRHWFEIISLVVILLGIPVMPLEGNSEGRIKRSWNLMSSFMNDKYDCVGGVRSFI